MYNVRRSQVAGLVGVTIVLGVACALQTGGLTTDGFGASTTGGSTASSSTSSSTGVTLTTHSSSSTSSTTSSSSGTTTTTTTTSSSTTSSSSSTTSSSSGTTTTSTTTTTTTLSCPGSCQSVDPCYVCAGPAPGTCDALPVGAKGMCASNEACGTSGTCVSTSGLNPKANGGSCLMGTDCLSGNCNASMPTNIICQGDADAGGACDIAADCGGATPGCAMHECQ